jgi:hypothetical protein
MTSTFPLHTLQWVSFAITLSCLDLQFDDPTRKAVDQTALAGYP